MPCPPGSAPVAILVHETSVCGGEHTSSFEYPPCLLNFSKLGNKFRPAICSKTAGSNESKPRIRVFIQRRLIFVDRCHPCGRAAANGQRTPGYSARRKTKHLKAPQKSRQAPGKVCHPCWDRYTWITPSSFSSWR